MSVQSPVIDHRVPLTHNEAMTLPSADLWRQAEEAEIKSLNGNNVLLPMRLPAGQKLMHTKWIYKAHSCENVTDPVTFFQKMSYRGYILFRIHFHSNFF